MNKIHKTIWSQSSRQWVVVSETVKSQGKRSASGSIATAIAAFLLCAGQASALDITGTVTTPQNTTDSVVNIHDADIDVTTTASEEAAVTINSSTTATVTIENVTIDSQTSQWTQTSPFLIEGADGANVQLGGTNTITLVSGNAGGSGLIASTANGAGNVSIDIAGALNVNNNSTGWYPDQNHGLIATANNGTATITHSGDGTIQVVGGSAIAAFVSGTQGDAIVTLQGSGGTDSIELQSSANLTHNTDPDKGNHGITASITNTGNTTGQVSVTTDAKITTSGDYSHGIHTQAQGGLTEVKNTGSITLLGNNANGIDSLNNNGAINIENSGAVSVSGTVSAGINASSGGGNIDIENSGTINLSGADSVGINAASEGGNITIDNSGAIISTGASSTGISASSSGGDITVESNTNITAAGDGSRGISVDSFSAAKLTDGTETGTVRVTDTGNNTINSSTFGIYAGGGDVGITSNSNITVSYTGSGTDSAVGIHADAGNTSGNARVDYDGTGHSGLSVTSNASGSGTYTVGIQAANAVAMDDPNNTGAASVSAAGDVTVKQTGGATQFIYGIEAASYGSGDASIHYKSGTVNVELQSGSTVNWGYGLLVQSIGDYGSGDLYIKTDHGTEVHTVGDNIIGVALVDHDTNGGSSILWADIDSTITTNGASAHGLNTTANNAAMTDLINRGDITTNGVGAHGIYSTSGGSGLIQIQNTGSIYTQNAHASTMAVAIYARNTSTGASDGIIIVQDGGVLKTHSYNGHGILALSTATSGDMNITVKDAAINLTGANSDGIDVQNQSTGTSDVDINITTVGGSIDTFDGSIAPTTASQSNYGIVAIQRNDAQGDINIQNIGTSITTGKNSDGTGSASDAIAAFYSVTSGTSNATGNINIYNEGVITTYDGNSKGIRATHAGLGNITVKNHGQITTAGSTSYGILSGIDNAASTGVTQILNTGAITTAGQNANAIHATSAGTGYAGEAITIFNTGNINVADARGIYARSSSGDVTVSSTGNITTAQATATTHNHGIQAVSETGKAIVIYDQGTIQVSGTNSGGGNSIGIAAMDNNSGNAAQESYITLGSQAIVDATRGVGGLQIRTNGIGQINIASGAEVHGGSSYGIEIYGTGSAPGAYEINNSGVIDSVNDRAILTGGQAGSTLTVNNYGTITGYIDSATTQVIFNNYSNESLNLRNFYDSDADGVADTKAVSVSTFGGGSFNNAATGAVRLLAVSGETTTITTGEYVPTGALSTATSGIVQGQLLNLATFNNAGLIDLTASGQAGDVLVISGGATAGSYGAGQYISNGGSLKLDSVLTIKNQGTGAYISQSDILVVDDAKLGSAPTRVFINPVAINGYQSSITQNDGIQVIEVLGTSDTGVFALGAPVTYGVYEYTLGQGTGVNAQNWYLRNTDSSGQIFMNPNAGAYLGNQYAAATMFYHNILDRRSSVRNTDSNIWLRMNNSDGSSHLFSGKQEVDIQSTLIQIGADLLHKDNVTAGVYGGYGHSQIDNRSRQTGSSADGKVDGYHLGAYVSWLPNEDVGPYVDAWTYYAWFDNKLQGQGQARSDNYDGTGYAFELVAKEDGSAWIFKPHAQVIYTHVDMDDFTDQSNTRYGGNRGSGIQTRLGTRLYGRNAPEEKGLMPFIELNWLHNSADSSIRLNGDKVESTIGRDVAELKLGVQGELSEKFSVWGHMSGQRGRNDFRRNEIQFGIGYRW